MQLANIGQLLEIVKPLLGSDVSVGIVALRDSNKQIIPDEYGVSIDGFYKHGKIVLNIKEGKDGTIVTVDGRYGQLDCFYYIPSFQDIVFLNYNVWTDYQRNGYELSEAWIPFLLQYGLIKPKTVYEAAR